MNDVSLINETTEEIQELKQIENLIDFVLQRQKLDNVMFNVIIVDNEKIHELNRNYRGVDRPTDVISFALEDDDSFAYSPIRVLGDIYISIDKAKEQADSYGHSLLRELAFLTVHGILHLLGYDHMNPEDEKEMFLLQELILDEYGIKREK